MMGLQSQTVSWVRVRVCWPRAGGILTLASSTSPGPGNPGRDWQLEVPPPLRYLKPFKKKVGAGNYKRLYSFRVKVESVARVGPLNKI